MFVAANCLASADSSLGVGDELMVEKQLQDDAGGNGDQHVVGPGLDPVVATRRCAQVMAAPVIHDILTVAILKRQTFSRPEIVIWAGTTSVPTVIVTLTTLEIIAAVGTEHRAVAAIRGAHPLVTAVLLLAAWPDIVAIAAALGEGRAAAGQGKHQDCRNNCLKVHD